MIFEHSSDVMNSVRDEAFKRFASAGFPSKKVERYKYTDIQKLFAPDYGLNLNRLQIPVDPYEAFRCDVPNLSTSLYFVVNDMFYGGKWKEEGEKSCHHDGPHPVRIFDYLIHILCSFVLINSFPGQNHRRCYRPGSDADRDSLSAHCDSRADKVRSDRPDGSGYR